MKKANKIKLNNVLYEVEDLAARNQIKELENKVGEGNSDSSSDPKRKYYETVTLNDEGTFYNEETGSWDVCTLEPNKFYIWQKPIDEGLLCINFAEEIQGVANEYLLQFSTGSNEVALESDYLDAYNKLKFQDGTLGYFMCDPYTTYQVSIVNGLATVISFPSTATFYIEIYEYRGYYDSTLWGKYIDEMTWGEWIENDEFSALTVQGDNYTFDSFGAFSVNDSGIIVTIIVGDAVELLDQFDNPVLATSKISDSPYYKLRSVTLPA